eukprot:gnl/Dysnectes_brevis/7740_a13282_192.p1 GENE.gnl/Dysnectes_brevis/7740_a13282_192~~gnl/Dysnectes_brevis/7740_a13282_192.p1  ORF type:complete len:327 (-),score=96.89 gnl/Dysnectes_brevis/7740_a13282_192:163-1143(-)
MIPLQLESMITQIKSSYPLGFPSLSSCASEHLLRTPEGVCAAHSFNFQPDSDNQQTLVFIHGLAADVTNYYPLFQAILLLRPSLLIVCLDLPGHGRSPALLSRRHYHHTNITNMLVHAIAALHTIHPRYYTLTEPRTRPVHLAGHSLGGAYAALVATHAPYLVRSLTMLAPAGVSRQFVGPAGFGAVPLWICKKTFVFGPVDRTFKRVIAKGAVSMWGAPPNTSDVLYAMYLQHILRHPGFMTAIRCHIATFPWSGLQGEYEQLSARAFPAVICWGTRDEVLPFSGCRIACSCGRIPAVVLKDIGHGLHVSVPWDVARVVVSNIQG